MRLTHAIIRLTIIVHFVLSSSSCIRKYLFLTIWRCQQPMTLLIDKSGCKDRIVFSINALSEVYEGGFGVQTFSEIVCLRN